MGEAELMSHGLREGMGVERQKPNTLGAARNRDVGTGFHDGDLAAIDVDPRRSIDLDRHADLGVG
jgi:hypothetical protein